MLSALRVQQDMDRVPDLVALTLCQGKQAHTEAHKWYKTAVQCQVKSITGSRGQGAALGAVLEGGFRRGLCEERDDQSLKWYEKAKAPWG